MKEKEHYTENTPLVAKAGSKDATQSSHQLPTIWEDAQDIVKLGVPIFIAMLSWVGVRHLFDFHEVLALIMSLYCSTDVTHTTYVPFVTTSDENHRYGSSWPCFSGISFRCRVE